MQIIKNNRPTRTDNLSAFNELRRVFTEISERYTNQKLNSSLKSFGGGGNRVTFKSQIEQSNKNYNNDYKQNENYHNEPAYYQHHTIGKASSSNRRANDSKSQIDDRYLKFYFIL
jgi:hypothetical protein